MLFFQLSHLVKKSFDRSLRMKSTGKGYCGKILHVDLSRRKVVHEKLEEAFYKKYLSGVGLASKVLWDRIKPGIDPHGPGQHPWFHDRTAY